MRSIFITFNQFIMFNHTCVHLKVPLRITSLYFYATHSIKNVTWLTVLPLLIVTYPTPCVFSIPSLLSRSAHNLALKGDLQERRFTYIAEGLVARDYPCF